MSEGHLLAKCQRLAEIETARIEKFKQALDKNPTYALTWSLDAFAGAAKLLVLNQVINALGNEETTVEHIRSSLTDRILHKSKYPPQSTSPTSNLIEQYELAACAELVSELQYYSETGKVRLR
jgi:hypothetical protein